MENTAATDSPNVEHEGWGVFWQNPDEEKLEEVNNIVGSHVEFVKKIPNIDLEAIRNLDLKELEELMSHHLNIATETKAHHDEDKGRVRKAGDNAVKFTKSVSEYIEAYSGIIEIMKGADQQYGGVAYATISLLLIVAVNKDKKEKRIEDTMQTLQREFIRIQTVKRVHGTLAMQRLVCDAFVESILFLRWATKYYAKRTWRRVLEALTKPPSLELDQSTAKIARTVAEIEKERDALDSKRLFEVQAELGNVRRTVDGISSRVDDIDARDEGVLLNNLREMVATPIKNRSARLRTYEEALNSAFGNLPRFTPFNMATLKNQQEYRTWETSSSSFLLLLYGETRAHAGSCCWLSPALFSIINQAQSREKKLAWFCCQRDAALGDPVSIKTIVKDLVDQLLEQSRYLLRKQAWYEEVLKCAVAVSNDAENVNAHFNLLQKVSQSFSDLTLIIDRSDLIIGETWSWLLHFVKLAKKMPQNLRILLIASSNGQTNSNGKLEPQLFKDLQQQLRHQFLRLELNNS